MNKINESGFAGLIPQNQLNDLGAGSPKPQMRNQLISLTIEEAFAPHPVKSPESARACLAGIWLLHDFLEESHRISQSIRNSDGSFWHGIMHRREGDYWNSKYWFRQVGDHPAYPEILEQARQAASPAIRDLDGLNNWDPFLFVDLCEKFVNTHSEEEVLLRRIQRAEWDVLFGYCFHHAVS